MRPPSLGIAFGLAGCALILGVGCATMFGNRLDGAYGPPEVRDRTLGWEQSTVEYHRDIQPIFDARCVVCHACYDAPCQLKLTSFEGVDRGASQERVYRPSRLLAAEPSRLFVDEPDTAGWRSRGFFPVLNERTQSVAANRAAGVLFRMLELKREHPLPAGPVLQGDFDFSLNAEHQCVAAADFDDHAKSRPDQGMPYGMPGLSDEDFAVVAQWIDAGAPAAPHPALGPAFDERIDRWETFWNGSGNKARLVSRYMYEHLFLADLYFEDLGADQTFRLVRSKTPPGEPIVEIATRRPFDDPGALPFYYRLRRSVGTPVAKTRMPYALSAARMERWKRLFFQPGYEVRALPGYAAEKAANPFLTFIALPVRARYRFMLEEAQFTIMGFIKGPVCRGQTALNVIDDHFQLFFVDPEAPELNDLPEQIGREAPTLELPAASQSNAVPLASWLEYSRLHQKYLAKRAAYLTKTFSNGRNLTLDLIWDGDGHNPNAALTVFRHFDSATVVKGLVGGQPKTSWLIGYSLLERIHYLLVAGFDVYGNVAHQLDTRMYMDFLRMEGETTFLAFLPADVAERELRYWYRDAEGDVQRYLDLLRAIDNDRAPLDFESDDPMTELGQMIREHLGPEVVAADPIGDLEGWEEMSRRNRTLRALARERGPALALMPELSTLRIGRAGEPFGEDDVYTLVANRAHTNVASLFGEKKRRRPDEDTLSVVRGVLGSHPNAFFQVDEGQLDAFIDAVASLEDEADYAALQDRYGVRRTDSRFWAYSDALFAWYREDAPVEAGRLDYNRFENR